LISEALISEALISEALISEALISEALISEALISEALGPEASGSLGTRMVGAGQQCQRRKKQRKSPGHILPREKSVAPRRQAIISVISQATAT
jgi:hypothetical protein